MSAANVSARTPQPKPPAVRSSGDVVGEHDCPACGATVTQYYRAGRGRVYCTRACRQRAYRWRRTNGVRLCVERTGPAERALTRSLRRHALRDRRDPVARVAGPGQREVSVCGTFVRPARLGKYTHNDFLTDHPWSCTSCRRLIGAPDE